MNTPKGDAEAKRYAETLESDREPVSGSGLNPFLAELADIHGTVEFQEHVCWNSLFVFPHKEFPDEPGEVVCQRCERRWRLEEEHRP